MECPKCRMEQDNRNLLCDYCGIVFAKYRSEVAAAAGSATGPWHAATGPRLTVYAPPAQRLAAWLRARLFDVRREPPAALAGRGILLAFLAVWGVRLMATSIESNGVGGSFLHLVNLPFHEAGHVFFTPFGDFVRVLGGTLGQLIMPMVCCLVLLLKTRDPFGAAVALWWFGENFLDIAPYIDDAGTGELPLLGGNTGESTPYGFHDWEYLMTETGRLGREHDLAHTSQTFGSALMVLALVWMAVTLYRGWSASGATRGSEQPRRVA
jgi:hypothetical protein